MLSYAWVGWFHGACDCLLLLSSECLLLDNSGRSFEPVLRSKQERAGRTLLSPLREQLGAHVDARVKLSGVCRLLGPTLEKFWLGWLDAVPGRLLVTLVLRHDWIGLFLPVASRVLHRLQRQFGVR